jgi:hypothetical protein
MVGENMAEHINLVDLLEELRKVTLSGEYLTDEEDDEDEEERQLEDEVLKEEGATFADAGTPPLAPATSPATQVKVNGEPWTQIGTKKSKRKQ